MSIRISMLVNGEPVEREIEPRLLLVHFLREYLGLTGTHIGCDTSQCGACTVHFNGQAVKSCTVLTVQAKGAQIETIESLASNGKLHRVQEAFRDHHGLQCGFCTPGMIMAAIQLIDRYPNPTLEQIKHQLDGNICRCTGYRGIINAVRSAAANISADKRQSGAS